MCLLVSFHTSLWIIPHTKWKFCLLPVKWGVIVFYNLVLKMGASLSSENRGDWMKIQGRQAWKDISFDVCYLCIFVIFKSFGPGTCFIELLLVLGETTGLRPLGHKLNHFPVSFSFFLITLVWNMQLHCRFGLVIRAKTLISHTQLTLMIWNILSFLNDLLSPS